MRAIAAWMILMYHFGVFPIATECAPLINVYIRSLMSCCVPVFFFLTGVLYARRGLCFKKGFVRASKLFVLTLVWALLLWPILALEKGGDLGLNLYVSGVLTLQQGVINCLWFLPALAILYLVLPFFCIVAAKDRPVLRRITVFIVVLVFGIDTLSRFADMVFWITGSQILLKAVGFINLFNPLRGIYGFSIAFCLVGMCWEEFGVAISFRHAVLGLLLAPAPLSVYVFTRLRLTGEGYDPVWYGYGCVTTLIVVLCLFALCAKFCVSGTSGTPMVKALSFIGKNSFGVYLLHQAVCGPMVAAVLSHIPQSNLSALIGAVLCAMSAAALSLANSAILHTKAGKWLLTV